jgi:hypothetical protein
LFSSVEQQEIERSTDQKLTLLNKEYTAGTISKQQYEDKKREIENEALRKSITEQIGYYKALVDLYEFDADHKREALNKIAELEKNLSAVGLTAVIASAEKLKAAYKSLGEELKNTVFDLLNGQVDQQKNVIQDQIDLLEKKKQKDIEVANSQFTNAQDRAAAITVIEKRAQAQRELLDQRQRQLDLQKAKFDRARAVANIIQNTAQGVTAALASIPPNPILAAIVGAIGAAQLVRTLAVPLPRFFKGKNIDSYQGYGVVDDGPNGLGNAPEAIIRKNGEVEMGGNKPRVTYLDKDDIVVPNPELMAWKAMRSASNITYVQSDSGGYFRSLESVITSTGRNTVKAIRNIPQSNLSIPEPMDLFLKSSKSWNELFGK